MPEHLVRLHLPLSNSGLGTPEEFDRWSELEEALDSLVEEKGVGSLDGNEIGGGEYTIWLYGPDGNRLAEVVISAAKAFGIPPGASVFLRHGDVEDPGAKEEIRPVA